MNGQRRRAGGLLTALLVLVAAACGGGGPTNPTDAVADAFDRTFSGPFTFEVSVELDEAARTALGEEDPKASALFDGVGMSGAVGNERFALLVEVMGVEAFEMRRTDATHTYVRLAISEVAEAFGEPIPQDEVLAGLRQLPPELQDAARAFLEGRWVAFVGDPEAVATPSELNLGPDPAELRSEFQRTFGDAQSFMERFAVVEETGSQDGGTAYTIRLRARELARSGVEFVADVVGGMAGSMMLGGQDLESDLAEVPDVIEGGEVVVRDRLLQRLSVDFLAMARSAAGDDATDVPDGSAALVATFADHGTEPDVTAPDDAVELDIESLADLFMQSFMMGGGLEGMESGFETVVPLEPELEPSEG